MTYFYGTTTGVGIPFTAELIWAPGTIADPVDIASPSSVVSAPSASLSGALSGSFTAAYNHSGSSYLGSFDGGIALLNGYTSGALTFEILAYNGADYASSSIRGRSGSFTMASVYTDPWPAGFMTGVPNLFVAEVPEPGVFGLVSFGGLLLGWRWRKSSRFFRKRSPHAVFCRAQELSNKSLKA